MQRRATLWLGVLLGGVAIALVPWTVLLNARLPSHHLSRHWDIAWTGFDVCLAAVLLATAVAALRRREWVARLATAGGTLLLCDAWFDTLTASTQTEVTVSLVEAFLAEVPLAVLCFAIARNPRFCAKLSLRRLKNREREPNLG